MEWDFKEMRANDVSKAALSPLLPQNTSLDLLALIDFKLFRLSMDENRFVEWKCPNRFADVKCPADTDGNRFMWTLKKTDGVKIFQGTGECLNVFYLHPTQTKKHKTQKQIKKKKNYFSPNKPNTQWHMHAQVRHNTTQTTK